MRNALTVVTLLLALALPAAAAGGQGSGRFGPKDVATPKALALALHRWASTTSKQTLDIKDLFYLMDRDSVAILLDTRKDGRPDRRLLRDWFSSSKPIESQGWLEKVVSVRIEKQGRGANAWVRYEVRHTPDGPVIRRGITDLQMYFDGTRWWGLGWLDMPITAK